jgi:alginate biosynthesis protein AlgK
LQAARAGSRGADLALAQLFSQGRGIKVERSYAYVFARLAKLREMPQADELLIALESYLGPQEKAQAERLLQQELQARGGLLPGSGQAPAMARTATPTTP